MEFWRKEAMDIEELAHLIGQLQMYGRYNSIEQYYDTWGKIAHFAKQKYVKKSVPC